LLTLYYSNKLFRISKNLIFTTKLLLFIVISCRKIQRKQEKYNRLVIFFIISLILINSITSRFREKNLKNLTINKK